MDGLVYVGSRPGHDDFSEETHQPRNHEVNNTECTDRTRNDGR